MVVCIIRERFFRSGAVNEREQVHHVTMIPDRTRHHIEQVHQSHLLAGKHAISDVWYTIKTKMFRYLYSIKYFLEKKNERCH